MTKVMLVKYANLMKIIKTASHLDKLGIDVTKLDYLDLLLYENDLLLRNIRSK